MNVTQQQTAPLRVPFPRIAYWQKQWWLVKRSPLTLLGGHDYCGDCADDGVCPLAGTLRS